MAAAVVAVVAAALAGFEEVRDWPGAFWVLRDEVVAAKKDVVFVPASVVAAAGPAGALVSERFQE